MEMKTDSLEGTSRLGRNRVGVESRVKESRLLQGSEIKLNVTVSVKTKNRAGLKLN